MTARPLIEVAGDGLARNMSAPPRSTVSFRPYGSAGPAGVGRASPAEATGLRHILRADPGALLQACLPDTVRRMRSLRVSGPAGAGRQDKGTARADAASIHALRLAGLVALASALVTGGTLPGTDALETEPLEVLNDRLVDLAGRLPPCPRLPAMAVAESLAGGSTRGDPGSTDVLPVLWTLTHLNGRTFDRDGLPILAPDLAEGGAWDFFAP